MGTINAKVKIHMQTTISPVIILTKSIIRMFLIAEQQISKTITGPII